MKKIFVILLLFCICFNSNLGNCCAKDTFDTFFSNNIMAHAMGGYDGNIYNNTEVALKNSIENGFKFIELDLILTSDEKLVCSHGWSKDTYEKTGVKYNPNEPIMSYKQFMNTKIQGEYDTMDAEKWFNDYVKKHNDIVWEIDLRTIDYDKSSIVAEKLYDIFGGKSKYLNRLLVQVGSEDMYNGICSVYKFKNYQYFLHKAEVKDIGSIIKFCKNNNIRSIAVNSNYMTKNLVKKIKDAKLKVLCYTVDDTNEAVKYIEMGANTICTNFITPNEIEYALNTD